MLLLPSKCKPKLLDLFCKAGGATRGYQLAGFHVTGVDIRPQPRYAGDRFIQADALAYLADHWQEYDAVHASPPCQGYSVCAGMPWVKERPMLIGAVRDLLRATGKPYAIENVPGAAKYMQAPVSLCGLSFGLKVFRHRLFECSFLLLAPSHLSHRGYRIGHDGFCCVAGGGDSGNGRVPADHRTVAAWRRAMGIDWMTQGELAEAVPPAYTNFVGGYLLKVA